MAQNSLEHIPFPFQATRETPAPGLGITEESWMGICGPEAANGCHS